MADPYAVLGLAPDSDEAEIRRRYLELVRAFPPDREPERFAAIRAAYEEVRDLARRLRKQLFEVGVSDSIDDLIRDLRDRLREAPIPLSSLLELGEPR